MVVAGVLPASSLTKGPSPDLSGVHSLADFAVANLNDLSVPDALNAADRDVTDLNPFDLFVAKAGGPDGVCSPGPMSSGSYDPDCVYLLGTLRPSSAGW